MKRLSPQKQGALRPAGLQVFHHLKKDRSARTKSTAKYNNQANRSSPFVSVPLVCIQINDHDSLDIEPFEGEFDRQGDVCIGAETPAPISTAMVETATARGVLIESARLL